MQGLARSSLSLEGRNGILLQLLGRPTAARFTEDNEWYHTKSGLRHLEVSNTFASHLIGPEGIGKGKATR